MCCPSKHKLVYLHVANGRSSSALCRAFCDLWKAEFSGGLRRLNVEVFRAIDSAARMLLNCNFREVNQSDIERIQLWVGPATRSQEAISKRHLEPQLCVGAPFGAGGHTQGVWAPPLRRERAHQAMQSEKGTMVSSGMRPTDDAKC